MRDVVDPPGASSWDVGHDHDPGNVAKLLIRLVFSVFTKDIGQLPRNVVSRALAV